MFILLFLWRYSPLEVETVFVGLKLSRLAFWMAFCVYPLAVPQAQDLFSDAETDSSAGNASGFFEVLGEMASPAAETPGGLDAADEPRDPTTPPNLLLESIPEPPPAQPTLLPTAKPTSARRALAIIPLPKLPTITLRGLVMNTPDRGQAMLNVDGKPITISLVPRDQQQRMPIPEVQFAAMQAALDQRAASAKKSMNDSETRKGDRRYEMCMRCSFMSDGVVFNLEAFTPDALLLRAVPHDSLMLIRKTR